MKKGFLLILLIALTTTTATPVALDAYIEQYRGQMVVSLSSSLLGNLPSVYDNSASSLFFDVVSHNSDEEGHVQVRTTTAGAALLSASSIPFTVVVADVADTVAAEREHIAAHSSTAGNDFYDTYRDIDELMTRYFDLAEEFSDFFSIDGRGESVEGDPIYMGVIATNPSNSSKEVYYVQSTQHAREWVATMTMCYIVETLLRSYAAGDAAAVAVLSAVDVHFIPIVNVDGYAYSWTTERFWRKNRAYNSGGSRGVDLNRNADIEHCGVGSSTSPTSDTYCGPAPFSEPETKLYSDYQLSLGPKMIIAVDIHTYGSLILRPFQVNNSLSEHETRNQAAGAAIQQAIRAVHGMTYDNIRGVQLYAHSGGFVDWAYLGTGWHPVSFTMELRGNSFAPPDNQIILSGEENYAGQVALIRHVTGV